MLRFALCLALLATSQLEAGRKLTDDERLEIIRGLTAEYATLKILLPRSKKPLPVQSDGSYDKQAWDLANKELGPAGRVGDAIQITKVTLEDNKILLEINGGLKSGTKWYERVEVGMGSRTRPINSNGTASLGTNLALVFPKGVPPVGAGDLKKMLLTIMDFEKRSATEQFVNTLPPEIQKAVKDQRVVEGMDKDTVIMAVGRPRSKSREVKDGLELEDWVYGSPPGKVTFVTFHGSKVIKVKDMYAGLGGSVVDPTKPPPN